MESSKRLTYGDTTNYSTWINDVDTFMKKYGEMGSIVATGIIPSKYTDPFPHPGENATTVELAIYSAKISPYLKTQEYFSSTLPKIVYSLSLECLSKSSEDRIAEYDLVGWRAAVAANEIGKMMNLIKSSHTFRGISRSQEDIDAIEAQWIYWSETKTLDQTLNLSSYKTEYDKLISKTIELAVPGYDNKQTIVARFLKPLKKYKITSVVNKVIDYLVLRDDPSLFPSDLDLVYRTLMKFDLQVKSDPDINSKTSNSTYEDEELYVKDADGNFITMSAQAKIRKSFKQKYTKGEHKETKRLNVHTDAYVEAEHEKTGKKKYDIRMSLKCNKCGGRYHISKDCRKNIDDEKEKEKPNGSESQTMSTLYEDSEIVWYDTSMTKAGRQGEHPKKIINTEVISIDNHSNTSIFNNRKLLLKIFKPPGRHFIRDVNGGAKEYTQRATTARFGEVFFDAEQSTNLLGEHDLIKAGWILQYGLGDEHGEVLYAKNKYDDLELKFEKDPTDKFYKWKIDYNYLKIDPVKIVKYTTYNSANTTVYLASPTNVTMGAPVKFYSQEAHQRAAEYRALHDRLEHPSPEMLMAFTQSNSIINCNLSRADGIADADINGECPVCARAKPYPNVGTHDSYDKTPATAIHCGDVVHIDIMFVNKKPRLLTLDDRSAYCIYFILKTKSVEELTSKFDRLVNIYVSYHHRIRSISCDNELVFRHCENFLNSRGILLNYRIPGEHERVIERYTRTIRERAMARMIALPMRLKLPTMLYDSLVMNSIDKLNITPNGRTFPLIPAEIFRGEKVNYGTDIGPAFGTPILVANLSEKSNEPANDIGIAVGRSSRMKGGVLTFIPGHKEPMSRRPLKQMPWSDSLITAINESSDGGTEVNMNDVIKFNIYTNTNHPTTAELQTPDSLNIGANEAKEPETLPSPSMRVTLPPQQNTNIADSGVEGPTSQATPIAESKQVTEQTEEIPPTTVERTVPAPMVTAIRREKPLTIPDQKQTRYNLRERTTPSYKTAHMSTVETMDHKIDLGESREWWEHLHAYSCALERDSQYQLFTAYMDKLHEEYLAADMSVKEAMNHAEKADAKKAMIKEMKSLALVTKTWTYVKNLKEAEPSIHTRMLCCKFIMKRKVDEAKDDDNVLWKARLAAGGHQVDQSIYEPMSRSSPTVYQEAVRLQLASASFNKLKTESMDIPSAYLNAALKPGERHLMRISKEYVPYLLEADPRAREFVQPDGSVIVQLAKSLYGLPEAGKLWADYLGSILIRGEYEKCPYESCMYKYHDKVNKIGSLLTIHVDDILHTYNDARAKKHLLKILKEGGLPAPTIKTLEIGGKIQHLGMILSREKNRILINQSAKIHSLAKGWKCGKTYPTPTDSKFMDKPHKNAGGVNATNYLSLTMSLMQIAQKSRPDILCAVSYLSTHCADPNEHYFQQLMRVLGYLVHTADKCLIIDPTSMDLMVYIDAAYGSTVHHDGKGHTGVYITLGKYGTPIYWRSNKQKIVSRSSTEAELIAMFDGMDIMLWCRAILSWMGYKQGRTTIHQDNTSTITISYMGHGSRTSHTRFIDMKYFWIQEQLANGTCILQYLPSKEHPADILASPRVGQEYRDMVERMLGE